MKQLAAEAEYGLEMDKGKRLTELMNFAELNHLRFVLFSVTHVYFGSLPYYQLVGGEK